MKKKVVLMLVVTALMCVTIIPMFTACTARENVLKILTIDEYLNEDLIEEFETYYSELTGKSVKVEVSYTPTNEEMYSKIALSKADYDIIVPSDYMVEKMAGLGLLLELSTDLGTDANGDAIEDYRTNVSEYLTGNTFASVPSKYACPYMWGTLGIVYNRSTITTDALNELNWSALWANSNYKIQMKDSVRDSMAAAAIYTYHDDLVNGTVSLSDVINYTDSDHLSAIQASLIAQKNLSNFYGYETDNGKTDVVEGSSDILLQWSGDAVYTLSDEHMKEVLGDDESKWPDLAYYVPDYSNVWCDYWAIPKYAENTEAANLWINFMCTDDAAIDSMDYIGYTSAVATAATFEYANAAITYAEDGETEESATSRLLELDSDRYCLANLSYFFTTIDEADSIILIDTVQYPTWDTLSTCAVMRDFGTSSQAIQDMWTKVKNS